MRRVRAVRREEAAGRCKLCMLRFHAMTSDIKVI